MRYAQFEFKAAPDGSAGLGQSEFAGYASTFGNVDTYGDIINPGAFAAYLPKFLSDGLILWQHAQRVPIGAPQEAREDTTGLWIRAKISDTADGRDCLTLMRDGVIKKLSIGYVARGYSMLSEAQARMHLGDRYDEAVRALPWWSDGFRLLTEIELREVSPVSFAANDEAVITGVKDPFHAPRLPATEREFEAFLRDAGFPRKAAVALTGHGWRAAQRDAGADEDLSALAASLKQAAAALSS